MNGIVLNRHGFLLTLLAGAVTASALGLAYVKHQQRQITIQLTSLERSRADLDREWSRLQLEESAVATPGRIERTARERLGMRLPGEADVWVLRP